MSSSPDENDVSTNDVDVGHGVGVTDNKAWKTERQEWADTM
jgi:hypothetical protein